MNQSENVMGKKIKGRGVTLWTESFGNAKDPAILLIAGAHAPSVFWPNTFCEKLSAAGYFVIRYDHRDIGYSTHFPVAQDASKPLYDLNDLASDALAILDGYAINRAHVVGHSMGGTVVQYLAAFHPDRVLRAVSMSVAVEKPVHQHARYEAAMETLLKNKPTGDFAADWNAGWKRSLKLLNGPRYPFNEAMAQHYTKTIYARHEGDFRPAWNHIAAQQGKKSVLNKLPTGMLFVNGTEDIFSPYEDIEALPRRFKTKILEGAGHMFFNEALWDEILGIVVDYLADSP